MSLAEAQAITGEVEPARAVAWLARPPPTLGRFNAADQPEGFRGSVYRYLGLLAATTKRSNESARFFEEALAANERMSLRPWLALTQRDYSRLLASRDEPGDRARADELSATALATFRELGMDAYAKRTAVHR